jgi:hypothetical protein
MKTTQAPMIGPFTTDAKAKTERKIIDEALERFKRASDFESRNREIASNDVDFRHGDQWPEGIRREREQDDRPCLTFNKMEERVDQITGDERINKTSISIMPADANSDRSAKNQAGNKDYTLSQTMNGLIRAIEQNSDAQIAYNTGADHAVGHGFGYWRIVTEWDEFDPFSQVIRIRRIKNAFSVYLDPDVQQPHAGDMGWGFISSMMDRRLFEAKYPGKKTTSFDYAGEGDEYEYWFEGDQLRIVEYFRKIPVDKIAIMMANGAIHYVDHEEDVQQVEDKYKSEKIRVQRTKEVKVSKVEWYKMTAAEILETPREFPSFSIPIIRCVGKELNVRGYDYFRGIVRHAKDAQRMYNYNRTAQVEQVALQPKVPFLVTPDQVETFEGLWDRANKENLPYLLYNHVDGVPPPRRETPPIPSQAHMMNAMSDDADMDATTGQYKASRGEPSNEKSGKAIRERKIEGDVAAYAYHDNKNLALKQTGRILVDMIPRIYDTPRIVRILNPEDNDDFIELNKKIVGINGKVTRIHDLAAGRYDIRVSTGPSYTTMRQESRESMMAFAGALPESAALISDLIAESQDWPKADVIAERLKKTLPPGLVDEPEGEEEITPQMVEQAVQQAQQEIAEQAQQEIEALKKEKQTDIQIKEMDLESGRIKAESIRLKAEADLRMAEMEAEQKSIDIAESRTQKVADDDDLKDGLAISIAEGIKANQEIAQQVKELSGEIEKLCEDTGTKSITITAPSGGKYTGTVKDSAVTIKAPSGDTYTGTVKED